MLDPFRPQGVGASCHGTCDANFTNDNGNFGGLISSVALQAEGKILIAGSIYATVDGTNRFDVVRLNADGTLDNSFEPGVSGFVLSLAVQADGRSLIGGNFIGNGTNRNAIARLIADGSLDANFDPSEGGIHALRTFVVMTETGALLSRRSWSVAANAPPASACPSSSNRATPRRCRSPMVPSMSSRRASA